jgi:hypothetical protein
MQSSQANCLDLSRIAEMGSKNGLKLYVGMVKGQPESVIYADFIN